MTTFYSCGCSTKENSVDEHHDCRLCGKPTDGEKYTESQLAETHGITFTTIKQ